MAYDTKVLLIGIGEIIRKSDSIEEIYSAVSAMANAEGVILKPYTRRPKKDTGELERSADE